MDRVPTLSESVKNSDAEVPVDLDHAISISGIGWYNIKYCLVLALFLIAAIVETVGYSFVMPSSMCDLNMSDSARGFISSIPYIGIVITSFPWGYLVDTRGRKNVIVYSSLTAGLFGILAAFMPELISFTICKFITSLCIACPAAAPYSFIGEILPQRYRDVTMSITNALQILGSGIVPLLAWAILPLDFRIDFGLYEFRPWRVITILYASFFIIAAILLSFGPESPKYLIAQGRHDEALDVLKRIYAGNKRKPPDSYPVKRIKYHSANIGEKTSFLASLNVQTLPLLKPPFAKWMALNGFLFFGVFSVLNGLYMWVPDILNRVLSGSGGEKTACQVIAERLNNTTATNECIDTIDSMTFVINTIASFSCALIAIAVSSTVKYVGKKNLLVAIFFLIGIFCILINFIKQQVVFAVLLSTIPITGLAIGPINAFAVEIFPTNLRGMAVSLSMMVGRIGSVLGTNVAGILINAACEVTFYVFGGLLVLCGAMSILQPRSQAKELANNVKTVTHL